MAQRLIGAGVGVGKAYRSPLVAVPDFSTYLALLIRIKHKIYLCGKCGCHLTGEEGVGSDRNISRCVEIERIALGVILCIGKGCRANRGSTRKI